MLVILARFILGVMALACVVSFLTICIIKINKWYDSK